jgi:hypothetical protein
MRSSVAHTWDPALADRSLCFDPLRLVLKQLDCAQFPSLDRLQRLVDGLTAGRANRALKLVLAESASPEPYERRLFQTGDLAVCANDWHDLFNVLVWCVFPRAKTALNRRHVLEMEHESPGRRGRARDALTQFDEDGVIVLSSAPELLELIRAFQWKTLFWDRRAEALEHIRFLVFGHALYEKLLAPFVGVTGKAVLLDVPAGIDDTVGTADNRVAEWIDAGMLGSPADLQPLPVLGIPGWHTGSLEARFYDNAAYFRPGRIRAGL